VLRFMHQERFLRAKVSAPALILETMTAPALFLAILGHSALISSSPTNPALTFENASHFALVLAGQPICYLWICEIEHPGARFGKYKPHRHGVCRSCLQNCKIEHPGACFCPLTSFCTLHRRICQIEPHRHHVCRPHHPPPSELQN